MEIERKVKPSAIFFAAAIFRMGCDVRELVAMIEEKLTVFSSRIALLWETRLEFLCLRSQRRMPRIK